MYRVLASRFQLMATLFGVFQVEDTQKWFPMPFFWGCPGTVPLAQGHPRWLHFARGAVRNRTPNLWLCTQRPQSYPASS